VSTDGTYAVLVTQSNGCTSTDTAVAHQICPPRIFVPKAFSPNGDLHNDLFSVYGSNLLDVEMQIYNRWGQLVYAGANTNWDGTSFNEKAKQGVYVYRIVYFYINETGTTVSDVLTGWVALLR
jgi:gliding motility-associated-like protein